MSISLAPPPTSMTEKSTSHNPAGIEIERFFNNLIGWSAFVMANRFS